jgi:hypothetical protein
MTASPAKPRQVTPGHPPSYSTMRNAKAAEWLAATREGRRRLPPTHCETCNGWHLTTAKAEGNR